MDGKLQACDLFMMLHLDLHTVILHGLCDILLLMHAHGNQPNPTKNSHIEHGLVHKRIMDTSYHTVRSQDPTRYIFYALCVDQLDSTLCTLS